MTTSTLRTGAAALVLLVGAACSGNGLGAGPAETTTTAADAAPDPPATRVVEIPAEGFSVELPSGWRDIPIEPTTLQRLFEEGGGALEEALANQARTLAGRGGKLFAYDESRRTTNLNVLKVSSAPGTTVEQVAEGLPEQLAQAGLSGVEVEVVTIAAGPAARATGSQPVTDTVSLFQLQYYVVSGNHIFVCVLATDDPARDRAALEAIAQTFTLL